jgi:[ribosomal protein S18]-alanine N-acetyltransferase
MSISDLDAVMEIASALLTAPQWSRSDYVAALSDSGPRRRLCRVMTNRGRVIGLVIASLVIPEAEVETIAVLLESQGQGFGALLLETALGELCGAGVTTVHLEVRASNESARALYRKRGFEETGVRRGYYAHPVEDAILLRRTLPESSGNEISTS